MRNTCVNKAAGIGVIIAVIIGIIIVSAGISMDSVQVEETTPVEEVVEVEESIPVEEEVDAVEETTPVEEVVEVEESIPVEEEAIEVEETTPVEEEEGGRNLSVEFTEKVGIKSP